MADIQLLLEAERRGLLPPEKVALLNEARSRGLIDGGMPDAPQVANEMPKQSWLDEVKGGIASAPINAYLGIKQMLPGGLDDIEKNVLQQNKEAAAKAPVSSIASNLAMLAPTAFIPGANTAVGASAIGAVTGLINPADSLKDRAINTVAGGGAGALGNVIGQKLSTALTTKLGNSNAAADAINSLNKPKADVLSAGIDAGYVVPPSSVNPSWINKRLESIAGKAAVGQEAAVRNQQVTNALARSASGTADDMPVSVTGLESIRKTAGKPYQDIGGLSKIAAQDLEALKQARNDAQGWFNAYNRSASPADLAKAKEARGLADMLEQSLEAEAKAAGRPELIPQLADARKQIAKTYTVQRALNDATGDVSAPVIGRLAAKGKPLSDGLDTIGKMQNTFPSYMREGVKIPTPGVSKSEALSAALLGGSGVLAGGPAGAILGALPLLSGPARSLVLSKPYQALMAKVPEASSPRTLKMIEALLSNKDVQGALPALSAQAVLGSAPMLQ